MIRLLRSRMHGDDGVALVLVIGTTAILFTIVGTLCAIAIRALNQGRTHDAFAVALGAHIVGFLYFLSRQGQVAPRFRTATWLSMAVMAASGYLFFRLGSSWDTAFVQDGSRMVPTGNRFDGGLRYVNWFVTVPVLLVQVLYALDLTRSAVQRLRVLRLGGEA